MLITNIFKHKHVKKKMQSNLRQSFAVFVQPHVMYCSVCKAVNGTNWNKFDKWTSLPELDYHYS